MTFDLYIAGCTGDPTNACYPKKTVITCEADMKKAVRFDHVCARYRNFHRSNDDFEYANVVSLECDNDHSDNPDEWLTTEKTEELLSDVAYVIVPSRHHMLPKGNRSARPRFHIFFPISAYSDAAAYADLKKRIFSEFPYFDSNALDAARFYFGSTGDIIWHDGSLTIENMLMLMRTSRSIPQGQRNATMSRLAGKLVKRFGVTDKAHEKFLEQAEKCSPPLDDAELDKIWNSACKFGRKVTSQPGYVSPDNFGNDPLIPDDFSDVGEARSFVECFGDEVVYTTGTDYLRYNGIYWEESEQAVVMAMIEHTDAQLAEADRRIEETLTRLENLGVSQMAAKSGGKKFRDGLNDEQSKAYALFGYSSALKDFIMKYRNIRPLNNALDAAKPLVLRKPEELDADPFLLNTPSGTYYLPDGLDGWRVTDPKDLITKVTAVIPNDEGMDIWLDALNVFFCGDQSLIEYAQLCGGMFVIGKVFMEVLIIAYGGGRNGKSTFWNAIFKVLGSYSGNISADALTVNCKRNVKPEMAELKGKRMIIASELQEGMRLNTSVVKQLCSTDPVFAEKKFKAPFTFEPSHTLVLYTNHLPKVNASDDGTWRRLIVIPFNAKIDGASDIKNYTQYLVDNAGGAILAWLIEGAKKVIAANFQITMPDSVKTAIGAYRDNNDWLGNFINECCDVDKSFTVASGDLYTQYRDYCNANGEYVRSTTDFYGALEQAGFTRKTRGGRRFIMGLTFKVPDFLE